MKKMVKGISLVLAVCLVIGLCVGCGGNEVSRDKGKLSYWVGIDSRAQSTITNYDQMLMYQELSKMTGIEIEFIHPTSGSSSSEAFQILLTQAQKPDLIEYDWNAYAGGPDSAIADKVIISLNDYIEEYAPDYFDYMEGEKGKANNYLYKKQALTLNGNYYGFNNLLVGTARGFAGLYVRKDLLDKWGLDIPSTIDDWTAVFAKAKENGIKYPLTGQSTLFNLNGNPIFNNAWNVGRLFHVEDDKIILSPETAAYKDYVETMADWMKKGYIDPNYITNTSQDIHGKITKSTSIASFGYIGGDLGALIPAMKDSKEAPDFELAACPYPVMKDGDEGWFQELSAETLGNAIAVTVDCGKDNEERYKDAVAFCNELYTQEGKILKSFGVEGKTYTKEKKNPDEIGPDGDEYKYIYTDLITNDENPGREEINAYSVQDALYHFMLPGGGAGLTQHPDYLDGFYTYKQQKDAISVWNQNIDNARIHMVPNLRMSDEETEKRNELWAKTYSGLDASIANIILGKADISTYDAAVAKAKKDGMDEIKKIYQAAYDRYVSID